MKSSHLVTPRSLSECQFTVGTSDPIVEPAQWTGTVYTTHFDNQRMLNNLMYSVAAIFLIIVVAWSVVDRFL